MPIWVLIQLCIAGVYGNFPALMRRVIRASRLIRAFRFRWPFTPRETAALVANPVVAKPSGHAVGMIQLRRVGMSLRFVRIGLRDGREGEAESPATGVAGLCVPR